MRYHFPIFLSLLLFTLPYALNSCVHKGLLFQQKQEGEKKEKKKAIHVSFAKNFRRSAYEAKAPNFMVTSQGIHATKIGIKIIEKGGNVVDAAAAVSFAIAVERPQSTGIGGGGFMLLHLAKKNKTFAIDFREKAPMLAHQHMYLDSQGNVIPNLSLDGPLSVGVPGMVAGILEVQKNMENSHDNKF